MKNANDKSGFEELTVMLPSVGTLQNNIQSNRSTSSFFDSSDSSEQSGMHTNLKIIYRYTNVYTEVLDFTFNMSIHQLISMYKFLYNKSWTA